MPRTVIGAGVGAPNPLLRTRMKTDALSELEFSEKTAARAQNEEMEFDVPMLGVVVVTNVSHDSVHSVNVTDGLPVGCSCKADQFGTGACKHRVAAAAAGPVLEAASASGGKRAIADGGQLLKAPATHADGCDNPECEGFDADGRPLLSFECWEEWA